MEEPSLANKLNGHYFFLFALAINWTSANHTQAHDIIKWDWRGYHRMTYIIVLIHIDLFVESARIVIRPNDQRLDFPHEGEWTSSELSKRTKNKIHKSNIFFSFFFENTTCLLRHEYIKQKGRFTADQIDLKKKVVGNKEYEASQQLRTETIRN